MIKENVSRLWFPPLTYYREDGSLDFDRMDQMLARVYPYCKGVLVPGSTGDGWILSQEQQEAIVRHFLSGFTFGRFRMFLGALLPTTEETKQAILRWCEILRETSGIDDDRKAMEALGVEGFVVCVPKDMTDPNDQKNALSEILEMGFTTAYYQLPQVTGALAEASLISDLSIRYENLVFVKDSGGGDELAKSDMLSERMMLLRGAEGDPTEMLFGETPIYDGLLLSTVNTFAEQYDGLLKGTACYDTFGEVIAKVFDAAAVSPISNAFSDANRAMDHVMFYGEKALAAPAPLCIGGKPLPDQLIALAYDDMERHGLVPYHGYGENMLKTI